MFKQIMIPVAAFAVTVTGASAFNSGMLQNLDVDLTDTQIAALEEAHELQDTAREEARAVLEDAGLDQEKMQEVREAMHSAREEHREAVQSAIEEGDYDAYLEAVSDTPQADLIDSEDDFEKLQEAQALRESGDREGAQEIMEELGFERPEGGEGGGMRGGRGGGNGFGGPGHSGQRGGWQSAGTE